MSMRRFASFLPLAIVDSPIKFPRMRFYQLWHDRAHHSGEHQWLRSLLTAASREWKENARPRDREPRMNVIDPVRPRTRSRSAIG
jgi:hypothetical protein